MSSSFFSPASGDTALWIEFVTAGGPSGEDIAYRGESPHGSDDSAAVWAIARYRFPTGTDNVHREWASGTNYADEVWDDRASLTYS